MEIICWKKIYKFRSSIFLYKFRKGIKSEKERTGLKEVEEKEFINSADILHQYFERKELHSYSDCVASKEAGSIDR